MSKEFQISDGNLIASFDLENEYGDIDFCKLLKVSHGVADEIGMFVDYVATNKIVKDQSRQISELEAKLAESEKDKLMWQEKWQKLYDETCNLNQDKISFCIEQLEKVKETMLDNAWRMDSAWENAFELIDNQIKEIKGEVVV